MLVGLGRVQRVREPIRIPDLPEFIAHDEAAFQEARASLLRDGLFHLLPLQLIRVFRGSCVLVLSLAPDREVGGHISRRLI